MKYIDNPGQRKGRAGISVFMWSMVYFLLNLNSIISTIKRAGIESHISVGLIFAIIFGPTVGFLFCAYKSKSEFLWKKSKDWTLYLLLASIVFGWGLVILKIKQIV